MYSEVVAQWIDEQLCAGDAWPDVQQAAAEKFGISAEVAEMIYDDWLRGE